MIVWVTRDEPPDGPLACALQSQGLEPIVEPVVRREVRTDPAELLAELGAEDWLVLTSPFAINVVARVQAARVPQVAVVGEASAGLARERGLRVMLVGADGHGDTLFAQLNRAVRRGVVCYPRSAKAKEPTRWADVTLRAPILYDTVPRSFDRHRVRHAMIAAVAAPSQVAALADIDIPLASIGRATSKAIRGQGREPAVEAGYPTFEELAKAIAQYLRK